MTKRKKTKTINRKAVSFEQEASLMTKNSKNFLEQLIYQEVLNTWGFSKKQVVIEMKSV